MLVFGPYICSRKFCEADIESILDNRTVQIKHDAAAGERSSIFSKVSFCISNIQASFSASQTDSVEMNDPLFWDKIKSRGELEVQEHENPLLQSGPRVRKSAKRQESLDSMEDAEDASQDIRFGSEEDPLGSDVSSDENEDARTINDGKRIFTKKQRIGLCLLHSFISAI